MCRSLDTQTPYQELEPTFRFRRCRRLTDLVCWPRGELLQLRRLPQSDKFGVVMRRTSAWWLTVFLVGLVAACQLGPKSTVTELVWLPDGVIYYLATGFDGPPRLYKRGLNGSVSLQNIDIADAQASDRSCDFSTILGTFVAPSGGPGLEFRCTNYRYYAEWTPGQNLKAVAKLDRAGIIAFYSDSASGVALVGDGTGKCSGLLPVVDGRLAAPFPALQVEGGPLHMSPPRRRVQFWRGPFWSNVACRAARRLLLGVYCTCHT